MTSSQVNDMSTEEIPTETELQEEPPKYTEEAAAQPEPVPQEPGPLYIDEVDRLRAENLNLKVARAVDQETILRQQIADMQANKLPQLQRSREELTQQMGHMRRELELKYGINLTTHTIRHDDGLVMPRDPAMTAQAAGLLKNLQKAVQSQ